MKLQVGQSANTQILNLENRLAIQKDSLRPSRVVHGNRIPIRMRPVVSHRATGNPCYFTTASQVPSAPLASPFHQKDRHRFVNMNVKLILADDHQMVRDGLRALIEKQPGLKILGEACNGRNAVSLCADLKPDLAIMDLSMPGLNGMAATRQILSANPAIKVLVLSMHADSRFVAETLSAGVSGYLLKDNAFEELIVAIHAVMSGKVFLSPQITALVAADYKQGLVKGAKIATNLLSERECEVLQLLAEGRTTKEIAAELNVSVKTVETHRAQVMSKLKLDSIAALTKYAVREGLTTG